MSNTPESNPPTLSRTYKRYALGAIVAVYTLNLLDRGLMGLLMQPIKEDLHLSDTQLGVISGIAFGLFYATMGVPIARWADRGNRVTITSLAIGLWGVTVMACLLVTNYVQLVLARMAAAVGESGCKPPTYSLVGDYFPESGERVRAMSIYWLGAPISALISPALGGWLSGIYGWRMTFFLMGIPGLLFAVLIKLTLIEPRTRIPSANATEQPQLPSFTAVLSVLWRQRSCRQIITALILVFALSFGLETWTATFMMRSHGMTTAELGLWLGTIYCFASASSVLLGGYVATRWLKNNERAQMRANAVSLALTVPCYIVFLIVPHRYAALAMLVPIMLALNFFVAPTYALMQRLVPDEMRATSIAVVMLLYNLIGMGIAPLVVGMLSDGLTSVFGGDALRYAMLVMTVLGLWAAYHFWQAGRTLKDDLAISTKSRDRLAVGNAPITEGVSG